MFTPQSEQSFLEKISLAIRLMNILIKGMNTLLKSFQVAKMDAIRVRSERFKIPFFYQNKKALNFN